MTTVEALADRIPFDTHRDRDFFLRVYGTPREVYVDRLRAVGFAGHGRVLDAACGFGQWSLALAQLNGRVHACDVSRLRVGAVREMARAENSRVDVCQSTIDALPYAAASVDAIFCYGAVFFTDYRVTFREFARVLAPGGVLYVSANGPGWYLHNLLTAHKPSRDFSPRRMALETFVNTVRFKFGRLRTGGAQIVISPSAARRALDRAGFDVVQWGGDGEVTVRPGLTGRRFFSGRQYGLASVYEILARKRPA
jgi:SAM-dependent methyltransferase